MNVVREDLTAAAYVNSIANEHVFPDVNVTSLSTQRMNELELHAPFSSIVSSENVVFVTHVFLVYATQIDFIAANSLDNPESVATEMCQNVTFASKTPEQT